MKLSDWLEKHKVSQTAFAARLGLSQATICRFLNGTRRPSLATMERIASATDGDVMPNDFFCEAQ